MTETSASSGFAGAFGPGRGDATHKRLLAGINTPATRALAGELARAGKLHDALDMLRAASPRACATGVLKPLEDAVVAVGYEELDRKDSWFSVAAPVLRALAPFTDGSSVSGSSEMLDYRPLVRTNMLAWLRPLLADLHDAEDIARELVPRAEREAICGLAFLRLTGPDGEQVMRIIFGARYESMLRELRSAGVGQLSELFADQPRMFELFEDWLPGPAKPQPVTVGDDVRQLIADRYRACLNEGLRRKRDLEEQVERASGSRS